MKTRNVILTCAAAVAMLGMAVSTSWATTLLPVTDVHDPGNTPDTAGYGSVGYNYRIGTTEVRNADYALFLNDVASASDPYGLYNTYMSVSTKGGITRSGVGPYSYAPKAGYADRPVNFVSWYDALRYSNYLSNKTNSWPTNTEYAGNTIAPPNWSDPNQGGYIITGGSKDSGNVKVPPAGTRLIYADPKGQGGPGAPDPAYYLLPTENEWYKAAYYKGANTGALSAGYFKYPTMSDTAPNSVLPPPSPGTSPNNANYTTTGMPLDAVKFTTPVGAYMYKPSVSAYGTYDQGGNVAEWTESIYAPLTTKIIRGGAFDSMAVSLASSGRATSGASLNLSDVGFRVALVPEPSTIAMLLGSAALALLWWLRRRV